MFTGKTIFLWQIKLVQSGDPATIARRAKEIGLSAVLIKLANGVFNYNLRPPLWVDDLVGPVVSALRLAGIKVIGWHYVYGAQPEKEAEVAAAQIKKYDLDAWIIDAESEYKTPGMATRAASHMRRLKSLVGLPVGLTTYRFPSLHPEFAWSGFLPLVDFHVPQVYWAKAHNPGDQLRRSLSEYRALEQRIGIKALPYLPAGAAYHELGWQPTAGEIIEFDAAAKALGLQGVSFWEWGHAIRYGFEDTIAGLDWSGDPAAPPSGVAEILADHEKRITQLEAGHDSP